jgi:hypothetical protein
MPNLAQVDAHQVHRLTFRLCNCGEIPAMGWRPLSTRSCIMNYERFSGASLGVPNFAKGLAMASKNSKTVDLPVLNLGDWVEIRYSGGQRGRIVEYRGPLGPKGAHIYRIRLRRKPKPKYVELPEDQLKSIPVQR